MYGATAGKTSLLDIEGATSNQAICAIHPCKDIDSHFLKYKLDTLYNYLVGISSGSARDNLSQTVIQNLIIEIPERDEQQAIAAVLSALDDKIELNNRINAELEGVAKLLYDYWFVQFDFPNAEGKPYKASGGKMVYNETLKRAIPEGWAVKKLCTLGSLKNGINYNPKDIGDTKANIINVRNISQSSIFINNDDLDVLELKGKDIQKYLVDENSIIIARSGIPGATRLIKNYRPNTIYCGFIICLNVADVRHQNHLYFRLKALERNLSSQSNGTIMQNVNQQVLNDVDVVVPEGKVLDAFNATINAFFNKIKNNLQQSAELASLRDWLLPMLMNGQAVVGRNATGEEPLRMAAEPGVAYGK